jgi:hypothetical protein
VATAASEAVTEVDLILTVEARSPRFALERSYTLRNNSLTFCNPSIASSNA